MVVSFFLFSTIVSPIWGEMFQPMLQINGAIKVNPLTPVRKTHFVVGCVVFSILLDKLSWPLHSLHGIVKTGNPPQNWPTVLFGACIIVHPDLFVI